MELFAGGGYSPLRPEGSREMIDAIRAAGGKPTYFEYPGVGHNSWDAAYDTDELYRWTPRLEEKLRRLPGLEDVNSDLQINNPQINVVMDRDKIAALGLTANQVETAMFNA